MQTLNVVDQNRWSKHLRGDSEGKEYLLLPDGLKLEVGRIGTEKPRMGIADTKDDDSDDDF